MMFLCFLPYLGRPAAGPATFRRLLALTVVLLFGGAVAAWGQVPLGQWQLHAPGTSASRLVEAGNALYVAGDYGLFRYDLGDNAVRALSKQDGLAGVNVNALAYDSATGLVVIGYRDANIDLLDARTGRITNVADIQRRTIVGQKTIWGITAYAGRAYLACSFGIVVLDLRRLEVADSYVGLDNGQNVAFSSIAVSADSILATRLDGFGVWVGNRRANLLDFHNWTTLPGVERARSVAYFNRHFYFVRDYQGLVRVSGAGLQLVPGVAATSTYGENALSVMRGLMTIAQPAETRFTVVLPSETGVEISPPGLGPVYQVLAGAGGRFYLADRSQGLLITDAVGAPPTAIAPNGPSTDVSFFTLPVGADTYAFAGGYSSGTGGAGRQAGFALRENGRWRTFSRQTVAAANYPGGEDIDLVTAAWNPVNNKLYIGSYGNGLIEWSGPDAPFRRYDSDTSPLLPSAGGNNPNARVTGVAVDAAGTVWVANFHQRPGQPGLFSFKPATAEWRAYPGGPGAEFAEHLLIDDNGYKWVTGFPLRERGTYVVVYDTERNISRSLTADATNGALLGPVYSIAKDRKGDIWLGTSKGVQVIYNPATVLASGTAAPVAARQPIIDRRPLLDNQVVKVIAVDGANRKWIGTDAGLYLFGEDGDEALAHFTAENSPLPANSVNSISINGVTGEVFVGTDAGLVSYRGSATEPAPDGKAVCTTVFPNPVPARYAGQVAFDGLTGGALVKITDVAGQLVYETKANGSRAVWNARDYQGRRVRTGIYLAYTSDADGQNTCVSKIAVMGE